MPTRVVCHAVAELPFLVAAITQITQGWRATQDDAVMAIRSWGVLSAHPPLVGEMTQASSCSGHLAFDPGPLGYWMLAIPVHIDHAHGVLWGAALVGAAGMAVCVEAAWAVRRVTAALAVAVASLVFAATQPAALVNSVWNPYLGVVWFAASCMVAWVVGTGRLRWWPLLVVVASIAAQNHLEYTAPAVLLAVLAPLVGLLRRRSGERGWRWLPTGLAVGAACWAAPFAQQITSHPGNMTLLLRCVGGQRTLGAHFGLQALSSAVTPPPLWFHRQGLTPRDPIHLIGQHSAALGVVVLVALAIVAVVAWIVRRVDLAVLAGVALVAAATTAWGFASIPADKSFQLAYLDVVLWPVGILVWGVAALGGAELARGATRGRWRSRTHRWHLGGGSRGRWLTAATGVLLAGGVANTAALGWDAAAQAAGERGTFRGVSAAAGAAERAVPKGPLVAVATGDNPFSSYTLMYGTLWVLISNGRQASVPGLFGGPITPPTSLVPGEPSVQVAVRPDGSVASVLVQAPSSAPPR